MAGVCCAESAKFRQHDISVAIIGDAVSRLEPEMIPLSIYLSNLTFFNLPRPATATTTTTTTATA